MKIPDDLLEVGIADMLMGEDGWTVPWAMYIGDDDELYLNGKYTYSSLPRGTEQMHVTKTTAGYVVDLSRCDKPRYSRGVAYVGDADPVPVAELIR